MDGADWRTGGYGSLDRADSGGRGGLRNRGWGGLARTGRMGRTGADEAEWRTGRIGADGADWGRWGGLRRTGANWGGLGRMGRTAANWGELGRTGWIGADDADGAEGGVLGRPRRGVRGGLGITPREPYHSWACRGDSKSAKSGCGLWGHLAPYTADPHEILRCSCRHPLLGDLHFEGAKSVYQ